METLMNFRLPGDLKQQFQNLCNERKSESARVSRRLFGLSCCGHC